MSSQIEKTLPPALWITSDQPISNAESDRLDRSHFASSLANALAQWSSPKSLVVGLHAPWGQGKTSIKNLVLESLKTRPGEWTVIDFNPWQWTSFGQLADAFFDEIAISIGKRSRKQDQHLARSWRRYAAKLKGSSDLAAALVIPLKSGMFISAALCVAGFLWPHRFLFALAAALLIFSIFSNFISSVLISLSEIIAPSNKDAQQSLDDVREQLAERLSRHNGNILVIVDDLDRLTPKDLADMIQLVKANGDLPHMVYLLLGDRQVMADHIGLELHVDGKMYLEKIVQVSLDLPAVANWRIEKILFSGLDRIIAPQAISKNFSAVHWQEVVQSGLGIYFDSLRSVNRYLATLEFHMEMLHRNSSFEVNAVDLIAMEALRLFEPPLYFSLRSQKEVLTNASLAGLPSKESATAISTELLLKVSEKRRKAIGSLLNVIFPGLQSSVSGYIVGAETKAAWSRELRVGSERHFDKYFAYLLDPREVSQADVQRFLSSVSTSDFEKVLAELQERGLLNAAVARLREYEQLLPTERIGDAITAIFNIGDLISPEAPGMFTVSPSAKAQFFIQGLLERVDPQTAVADLLKTRINQTSGLLLPAHVVLRLVNKLKEETAPFSISTDDVDLLKTKIVEKIAESASSGELIEKEEFHLMLYLWKDWGSLETVRAYVRELCRTQVGTLAFLSGIVRTMHSSVPNKQGGTARHYIGMADIEDFSSAQEVQEGLHNGDLDLISNNENHKVIELLMRAIKRKQEGKSDDGFGTSHEDEEW